MKKRKDDYAEPVGEVVWRMFEKTGSISYYMLYKKLKDDR